MGEKLVLEFGELNEMGAIDTARQLLRGGCTWLAMLRFLQRGMDEVGEKYERGEYFIADLILSSIIFRSIMELEEMQLARQESADEEAPGIVLIGTVEGDVHDIAKDTLISLLQAKKLMVIDLGTDVKPDEFVEQTRLHKPRVLALSGTMSFAVDAMRQTVEQLARANLRDELKIMVGGSAVNEELIAAIGADGYSKDFMTGLELCQRWLGAGPDGALCYNP